MTAETKSETAAPQIIKNLREQCGFTVDELASLFDVTPIAIYNWQVGKSPMNRRHAQALLGLFDYLSGMQDVQSRKMFATGYITGRMHGR